MSQDIVIVGGARTAMCEYVGTPGFGKFKDTSAIELGAHAARAALQRAGVSADAIDHVVVGNALQTSIDAIYGARHVGLKAGVPEGVPALTVNRLCGSGLQSIVSGAQMIALGEARTVLAGGMENMSQAPYVLYGARQGFPFGTAPQMLDSLFGALMDPYAGLYMAQTAERLAKRVGVSREEQDVFALRSHMLGAAAVREGRFAEEIAPVTISTRKGDTVVHDLGSARQAAPGLRQGGHGHGRQRQRRRRWRGRGRAHQRRARQVRAARRPGAHRVLGHRRL
jgi:acetyl-CoA acyltransferase 2